MTCDGNSEKDISIDQTSNQTKSNSEDPPPLQRQILSEIYKIRKNKNHAAIKTVTKKINKTSGTSFDEG